jgi:hypothetical protein
MKKLNKFYSDVVQSICEASYFRSRYGILVVLACCSCSSENIKEKINKTGDVAGQAIGEFTSGVTSGVEKAIEPKIEINDALAKQGLTFGKSFITTDSADGENILNIYIIYNVDFTGSLTAKAYDSKGLEMGRVKLAVEGKKEEAGYLEFRFDKRTDMDNDSRITIE